MAVQYESTFDIGNHPQLIKKAIAQTSVQGFFCWDRYEKGFRERLKTYPSFQEHLTSVFAHLGGEDQDAEALLDLRAEARGGGEWIIGGLLREFAEPKSSLWQAQYWGFHHILTQADRIGCIFYQDGGQVTILTKIFDGVGECG